MPARLVALDENQTLLLDKPIILIGRHQECDVQLESRKVSRRHCCIAQVEDHLVVRDLESTNGVRVNGKQVLEGRLDDGDELIIGNLRFQVKWDDPPPPRPGREHQRPRKPTSKVPPPAPVEVENLVSCDFPIPLKDSEACQEHELAAPQGANGTERAEEEPQPSSVLRRKRRTELSGVKRAPLPDAEESSSEKQLPDDVRD